MDGEGSVHTVHVERLQLDHIAQPALDRSLECKLERGGQFWAIGRKDQLQHAAAKVRPVHAFARVSKDQLFEHGADVFVVAGRGRAPPAIDVKGKVNVHGK